MKGVRRLRAWAMAALLAGSCSEAQNYSGTNTNWLQTCDTSEACVPGASCLCGLCTAECTQTTECAPGVCGSALASLASCDGIDEGRICLPEDACAEFELPEDGDLGAPTTPTCANPGALICESFDEPLPEPYSVWLGSEVTRATIQDCLVHAGDGASARRLPSERRSWRDL